MIFGILWWQQRRRKKGGNVVSSSDNRGNWGLHAILGPRISTERMMDTLHVGKEMELSSSHLGLRKFSHKELKRATQNFNTSQMLGSGGFGCVFRGILQDEIYGSRKVVCVCTGRYWEREDISSSKHQVVAVKRISSETKGGLKGFIAELTIISDLRHRNLVRLHGWGEGKGWLLLVYEYMPNGSLETILHNDKKCSALDWTRRFNICSGLGSALLYLHEECDKVILHRDIKSSNVLLDERFNAKLGDFGLSRLLKPLVSGHVSMPVAGTRGYMAREIFHTGRTTKQSDVFAFGAVLAEIATGRRPIDEQSQQAYNKALLVDWMWDLHNQNKLLEAADKRLHGNFDTDQMMRVMVIALACSHPDPQSRPSIKSAMDALHGTIPLPSIPSSKPLTEFSPILSILQASSTTNINISSNDSITSHSYLSNYTRREAYIPPLLRRLLVAMPPTTVTSSIRNSSPYANPISSSLQLNLPLSRASP